MRIPKFRLAAAGATLTFGGWMALAALCILLTFGAVIYKWTISDKDRAERLVKIIEAFRGKAGIQTKKDPAKPKDLTKPSRTALEDGKSKVRGKSKVL